MLGRLLLGGMDKGNIYLKINFSFKNFENFIGIFGGVIEEWGY